MYIRRDRKMRDGKEVVYASLAHNVIEDSKRGRRTKPVVFANLGNEEDLSLEVATGMVRALERYIHKRWGEKPAPSQVGSIASEVKPLSATLRVLASKELGVRLLLSAAWNKLGIGPALTKFEKKHRCEFPVERLVFAMVLNRLVDPMSKRACNVWCREEGYLPEAKGWDVHQFYRALDVLHEHWAELEDLLARALFERLAPADRAYLLADTTTLYFEARANDRELAALEAAWEAYERDPNAVPEPRRPRPQVVNEPPLRMQGHNKDGHPGDPQVVIASVCTPGGFVLRHRVYPGNTSDFTVAADLIAKLPKLSEDEERVWISDAGMVSKKLFEAIDEGGWKRLTAEGPRKSALGQSLLSEHPGRYRAHPTKEDFSFKEFDVPAAKSPSGKAERWLVTRNERDRERVLGRIDEHVERAKEGLARQREAATSHPKKVCELVSHKSLHRYVRPSEKVAGTYVLDQEAIRREKMLAGVRFYRTTKLDWDGVAMWGAYQKLQEVEANHREYKGPLLLQPCYHRTERRIEAHVMLTILAVNVVRFLEAETGRNMAELRRLFGGVKAVELAAGKKSFWQRSELTDDHMDVLKRLSAGVPAHQWTRWIDTPAPRKKRA